MFEYELSKIWLAKFCVFFVSHLFLALIFLNSLDVKGLIFKCNKVLFYKDIMLYDQ